MTKLEDLTKALLKRRYYDCEPEMYESEEEFYAGLDTDMVAEARGEVAAVIATLREPNHEMLDSGCRDAPDTNSGEFGFNDAEGVWTRMIDHLLSEAGERA